MDIWQPLTLKGLGLSPPVLGEQRFDPQALAGCSGSVSHWIRSHSLRLRRGEVPGSSFTELKVVLASGGKCQGPVGWSCSCTSNLLVYVSYV